MSEPEAAAPLSGFRVLDFTQVVAGPFCATMLADMGAEVVKIERPGFGDDTRRITRYKDREEHEDYFYANNRSKKSVAINMKTSAGRDAVRALAGEADALIENMAPGKLAELGLGWEDARAMNPGIVYCSLSGFGQSGPYRDRVGIDPILQAVSGVMSVTGMEDPTQIGAPLADVLAGMFAAYAIVSALHAVRREGEGRHIDVSIQDAMVAALGPRMGETLQAGVAPGRHGNQNPIRVPANTYKTSDGEYVTVIVQHDGFWPGFCRALEHRGLAGGPALFDRAGARGEPRRHQRAGVPDFRLAHDGRMGKATGSREGGLLPGERLHARALGPPNCAPGPHQTSRTPRLGGDSRGGRAVDHERRAGRYKTAAPARPAHRRSARRMAQLAGSGSLALHGERGCGVGQFRARSEELRTYVFCGDEPTYHQVYMRRNKPRGGHPASDEIIIHDMDEEDEAEPPENHPRRSDGISVLNTGSCCRRATATVIARLT